MSLSLEQIDVGKLVAPQLLNIASKQEFKCHVTSIHVCQNSFHCQLMDTDWHLGCFEVSSSSSTELKHCNANVITVFETKQHAMDTNVSMPTAVATYKERLWVADGRNRQIKC